MSDLVKLAVMALAGSNTAQQAGRVGGRVSLAAIYIAGSVIAGTITAGCLLAALWTSARPYTGVDGAYLVVAAAAVLSWAALFLMTRRESVAPSPPLAGQNLDAVLKEAAQLFDRNKSAVLIAALVAGLMAGSSKANSNIER